MSRLIVADSSVLFHFSIKLEDGSVADSTALHGKPARLRMGDGSLTNTFLVLGGVSLLIVAAPGAKLFLPAIPAQQAGLLAHILAEDAP